MKLYTDFTDGELKDKAEEIVDYAYKVAQIDNFWIAQFQELINYGGKEIYIRLENGNDLKGILTGVHQMYVQLNSSIKIFFDKIISIAVKDDGKKNNDSQNQDNIGKHIIIQG